MGLLFQKRFHEGLVAGTVRVTFRRWQRAQVKPGGRYRCHPIGVLEVDAVAPVRVGDVGDADAQASGFADVGELLAYLAQFGGPLKKSETVFRVELHHAGDVDAKPTAFQDRLSVEEVQEVRARLERLDRASPVGAWTRATLSVIARHPHRRAGDLADLLKREKLDFKEDVRKLKRLGLTIAHEVGYSLSPRGKAFLEAGKKRAKKKSAKKS